MSELRFFLEARQRLQKAIHDFFAARSFLSIDTPIAVRSPGTEVHLRYFASSWLDHGAEAHPLFLRSSPELHLKQALSQGLERVYHLGKCFRNGGELSPWHHPEFTMLEWYEAGISLSDFMKETEELLHSAAEALRATDAGVWLPPRTIPRVSVFEAFERWAGLKLIDGDPSLGAQAEARGFISIRASDSFEDAYFKILIDVIEPELKKLAAVILYDYPASQCALARIENGRAQRFELYLRGIELCNAFDELVDPALNRERIQESNRQRRDLGLPEIPEDSDFYAALQQGLPSSCGNALGFDRLLALLLGETSLDRVIPFRWNQPYQKLRGQQTSL